MEGKNKMNMAQYSEDGFNYPTLVCSKCGKRIFDAKKAIITFQGMVGTPYNEATGVYHKVLCDPGGKVAPYCDELNNFLVQLMHNLKVDPE
jgi:hypothetical protein